MLKARRELAWVFLALFGPCRKKPVNLIINYSLYLNVAQVACKRFPAFPEKLLANIGKDFQGGGGSRDGGRGILARREEGTGIFAIRGIRQGPGRETHVAVAAMIGYACNSRKNLNIVLSSGICDFWPLSWQFPRKCRSIRAGSPSGFPSS